jgi:hypothetical protein
MTYSNRIGQTEILPSHWLVTPSAAPVPLDRFEPARRLPRNLLNINYFASKSGPLCSIPTTSAASIPTSWAGKVFHRKHFGGFHPNQLGG